MKTLVLAEKPSVGKDIANALGLKKAGAGYIEGNNYIVTWALGHLVTLADPEVYDKKFKTWSIEDLPIIPKELKLVVINSSRKQFTTVKELLNRKDVNNIVIATDAGREGELVARWILEKCGCKKPVKRLWISSVTEKAIKEGFNSLKDGKFYENLANSAKARAAADWIVGINATRCLTTKYDVSLSCGRVQTPTVAIILKRENDIKNFKPRSFYGLSAKAQGGITLTWADNNNNSNCFDENVINSIFSNIQGEIKGEITDIHKSVKKKEPPKLYDLTELQRDANNRYGFTPKETLSILQKLYEHYKIVTYPRTDSRYITEDIVVTIPERLKACSSARPFGNICEKILKGNVISSTNYVDNKKVTDHHALIPTEQPVNYLKLSEKERKIYDLVIMRFLTVLYPPFEYEQTKISVKIGNEIFYAKGKTVLKAGFTEITRSIKEEGEDETQPLPKLNKGQILEIKQIKKTEGKTKPPAPFNEATLLSAMENPAKYMELTDSSIINTLGETGGLGTVATRADIIEKLFDSALLEKNGKDIFITEKGKQLLEVAPDALRSPEMTGKWEQKLLQIAGGKLNKEAFLKDIKTFTHEIINDIKVSKKEFKYESINENMSKKEVSYYMHKINKQEKTEKNSAIADALKNFKFD